MYKIDNDLQNLTPYHHLYCYYSGPSYYHLLRRLMQHPPLWSLCFYYCFPGVYSQHSSK